MALTLLYLSTRFLQRDGGSWLSFDEVVDLADDVAFEASDDVAFGLALGGSSSHVSFCRFVVLHPDNDGAVDRRVELAVPSVVVKSFGVV